MNNETYRSGNRYHYKSIFMDVNNRVMMGRELKMLGQFAPEDEECRPDNLNFLSGPRI
jgi:hypothetical protein